MHGHSSALHLYTYVCSSVLSFLFDMGVCMVKKKISHTIDVLNTISFTSCSCSFLSLSFSLLSFPSCSSDEHFCSFISSHFAPQNLNTDLRYSTQNATRKYIICVMCRQNTVVNNLIYVSTTLKQ